MERLNHLKRFDETRLVFTPEEGKDVRGALKKLLSEVKKKSKGMKPESDDDGFDEGKRAVIELLEQLIKERV